MASRLSVRIVLPPISTEGMTSADVHKLADDVRDQMLTTLKEISTPSPEARQQDGEGAPLLEDQGGEAYGSAQDSRVRRRVSRGDDQGDDVTSTGSSTASSSSAELVQTGAVDAKALAGDVKNTAKRAVVADSAEGETEDEMDEHGAVIVKKPN